MGNTRGQACVWLGHGAGTCPPGTQLSLELPLDHSPADFFRQEVRPSAEGSEVPSPPPNSEPK